MGTTGCMLFAIGSWLSEKLRVVLETGIKNTYLLPETKNISISCKKNRHCQKKKKECTFMAVVVKYLFITEIGHFS